MTDIRQSEAWSKYLEMYGWQSAVTSGLTNIEMQKTLFGKIAKIQRPKFLTQNDLAEIDAVCKKEKILLVKLEPELTQNLDILKNADYFQSFFPLLPPSTIYIDLQKSENQLWEALSHTAKSSIKASKKASSHVHFYANPPEDKLKMFYKIEKETGTTKKFHVQNFADLKRKAQVFGEHAHIAEIRNSNNTSVAANFYLCHEGVVYHIHGGTSNSGRVERVGYGYHLMWQSILYFKNLGFKALDLEGKDDGRFPRFTKNWEGFSFFKERFGGQNVQFPPPYIKLFTGTLKILAKIYNPLPL